MTDESNVKIIFHNKHDCCRKVAVISKELSSVNITKKNKQNMQQLMTCAKLNVIHILHVSAVDNCCSIFESVSLTFCLIRGEICGERQWIIYSNTYCKSQSRNISKQPTFFQHKKKSLSLHKNHGKDLILFF